MTGFADNIKLIGRTKILFEKIKRDQSFNVQCVASNKNFSSTFYSIVNVYGKFSRKEGRIRLRGCLLNSSELGCCYSACLECFSFVLHLC